MMRGFGAKEQATNKCKWFSHSSVRPTSQSQRELKKSGKTASRIYITVLMLLLFATVLTLAPGLLGSSCMVFQLPSLLRRRKLQEVFQNTEPGIHRTDSVGVNRKDPTQAVFVLAAGRSGSTTTLFMLNQIPGFALRGENNGVLYKMLNSSLSQLVEGQQYLSTKPQVATAWFHADSMDMPSILAGFKDLVIGFLNPPEQATTIGFKELVSRIFDHRRREMIGPAIMAQVFPGAKFILNYRYNESSWLASEFWQHRDKEQYRKLVDGMLKFRERNPQNTFILHTEEMQVDKFNELLTWLDVDGCKYTSVLSLNKRGGVSRPNEKTKNEQVIECQ